MNENWCALCISILKSVTPEQAFDCMNGRISTNRNPSLTDKDIEDMFRLKKTHTYTEIGKMYGLSENAVFKRMKRHTEPDEKKAHTKKETPQIYNCESSGRVIFSEDMLAIITDMKNQGYSYKEIGSIYGIGAEAIRAKICRFKKKVGI